MSETPKKLEVYKPAQTIRTKDKLSRTASITALMFIREMFSAPDDQREHTIPVLKIYQTLGYKESNYTYIKTVIHELLTSLIEWDVVYEDEKSRWKASAWCSFASLENGMITFSFSDQLKAILKSAGKIWHATISLPVIAQLNSRYAVKLYELCKLYFIQDRANNQTPLWELAKWHEYFGVENHKAYREFKRFAVRVLTPAVSEINSKTDITVQPYFKREGRKISHIKLVIKKNPNDPLKDLNLDSIDTNPTVEINSKPKDPEPQTDPITKAKIEAFKKARAERKNKNPNIKIDKGLHALKFGG